MSMARTPSCAPQPPAQDPVLAAMFHSIGQTYDQGIARLCQQVERLLHSVPPVRRRRTRTVEADPLGEAAD